jgi:hypothetical protein
VCGRSIAENLNIDSKGKVVFVSADEKQKWETDWLGPITFQPRDRYGMQW